MQNNATGSTQAGGWQRGVCQQEGQGRRAQKGEKAGQRLLSSGTGEKQQFLCHHYQPMPFTGIG